MTIKKLPLGGQVFKELIENDFLYADKTKYAYDLIKSGAKHYFLSRPRRFGKTLFLTTLKELFTGNRDRFEGLWIGNSDYDFPAHPIIQLSFSADTPNAEILRANLLARLKIIANDNKLKVKGATIDVYLGELIKALANSCGSPVVILIDEYDAPVTRFMSNLEVGKENALVLHNFFASLKDCIEYTHLTFVTGITRYALTSMDSGSNHLNDISLDPHYSGICGFTLEEFDALFEDRMKMTLNQFKACNRIQPSANMDDLKTQIRRWYDGYTWGAADPTNETRVLNPYSILNFFNNNYFDSYWIQSGRPAHLTTLIEAKKLNLLELQLNSLITSAELKNSDLTRLQTLPILFHSGYLTIDKLIYTSFRDSNSNIIFDEPLYSLRFPNHEVSSSYYKNYFI
jgi:hypothetical protein